jgi:hypothetical protein
VVREGEISNLKGLNELKRARLQDPTLGNDLQLKAEFAEILLLASVDGEMRMPGSTPPTSQLDWLSSTTAMIVLLWSRATFRSSPCREFSITRSAAAALDRLLLG